MAEEVVRTGEDGQFKEAGGPKLLSLLSWIRGFASQLFFLRVPLSVIVAAGILPWALHNLDAARSFGANLLDEVGAAQAIVSIIMTCLCLASSVCTASIIAAYGDRRFRTVHLRIVIGEGGITDPAYRSRVFRIAVTVAFLALVVSAYCLSLYAVGAPGGASILSVLGTTVIGLVLGLGSVLAVVEFYEIAVLGKVAGFRRLTQYLDGNTWTEQDPPVGGDGQTGTPLARFISWIFHLFLDVSSPGFFDAETKGVLAGHAFAFVLANVAYAVYALAAWWGYLDALGLDTAWTVHFQAYAFAMLGLMVISWIFSLLTFYFDRHHIPVLTVVVLYSLVLGCFDRDYYVRTWSYAAAAGEPAGAARPVALQPFEVLRRKLASQSNEKRKKLVLVSAKGGGIQAAAWTARVLTGLEEELEKTSQRKEWRDRIVLFSGVSGGSVGSYYYLDRWPDLQESPQALDEILEAAMADKLGPVAWGLTVPDFWKAVWPIPMREVPWWSDLRYVDRGWGLQRAIRRYADEDSRDATLADWTAGTRNWALDENADAQGPRQPRPAVIFNSTVAELGKPILFTSTRYPDDPCSTGDDLSLNFSGVQRCKEGQPDGPGNDLDMAVTDAVRLSSSFPVVSPASSTYKTGIPALTNHFNDGGYYDNYGIRSLTRWLRAGLEPLADDPASAPNGLDILILQVLPAETAFADEPNEPAGAFAQLWYIVGTLYEVAMGSQTARNTEFVEIFESGWEASRPGLCIEKRDVEYRCSEGDGCANPPMNWRLTNTQQEAIRRTWTVDFAAKLSGEVREFLARDEPCQPIPPGDVAQPREESGE